MKHEQLNQYIRNIEQWAEDRNLIQGSSPKKQMLKFIEEIGELCSGIAKHNSQIIQDSIGDVFVVMVILNKQTDTNFNFEPLPLRVDENNTLDYLFEKILARVANIYKKLNCPKYKNRHIEYDFAYILFCLIRITEHYQLDFITCIKLAWNEIKYRKGK